MFPAQSYRAPLLCIAVAGCLAGLPAPAHAAIFGTYDGGVVFWRPAYPTYQEAPGIPRFRVHRPKKPRIDTAKDKPNPLAVKAQGVLQIAISLRDQRLRLYSGGEEIAQSRISTGMPGHPTPTGVFSVIQKQRWHESNIYSGAPMPFMQRITWSGVALHLGVVPGYPASHGCIRMPDAFARELWGLTRLGVRVVIAPEEVRPVPFEHARLFAMVRPSAAPAPSTPAAHPDAPDSAPTPAPTAPAAPVPAPPVAPASPAAPEVSGLRGPATAIAEKRDPIQIAAAAAGNAVAMAAQRVTAAAGNSVAVAAQRVTAAAGNSVAMAGPAVSSKGEETPKPAERPLKPGPISVFISRKEGKLFVRKGFEPLFDAPVTIERPTEPLGTHLFTALALKEDGATFRWDLVTMPVRPARPVERRGEAGKIARHRHAIAAPVPLPAVPAPDAASALDRITIPDETAQRISELMSPGASLIISDAGLGPETGTGTDFIVLTR